MTIADRRWPLHRRRSVPYWVKIKLLQTRPRENKSARQSRNVPWQKTSSEAIRKASEAARKAMEKVSLNENTIPHEVIGEYDGARVLLRPASPGTGVIAGGGVRAVAEAAGIRDVLAKSLGSSNHANVVKATIAALKSLRRRDQIYKLRGIHFNDAKGNQHDASS